jgi:hypothetical protein
MANKQYTQSAVSNSAQILNTIIEPIFIRFIIRIFRYEILWKLLGLGQLFGGNIGYLNSNALVLNKVYPFSKNQKVGLFNINNYFPEKLISIYSYNQT